ncbi:MAG: hypothetical protein BVN35_21560 [Proteobacteria bacterium ST_bin11]|nr:MAG: hypothetical protein BVN35_21560 [Proteobacteria bacterium ST_bin11]
MSLIDQGTAERKSCTGLCAESDQNLPRILGEVKTDGLTIKAKIGLYCSQGKKNCPVVQIRSNLTFIAHE